MRENYDFTNAVKNPYKFTINEKLLAYLQYIYKISKLNKDDFRIRLMRQCVN